jgi:hypothetical protein
MSYIVTNVSPVRHNGTVYQEGDSIPSLTEEQAAPLLELGVISEATQGEPEQEAEGEPQQEAAEVDAKDKPQQRTKKDA